MTQRITSGETVFFAAEPTLWDMRQAAKLALRDDVQKIPFIVTDEIHYYSDFVERLFLDTKESMKNALELGEKIVGEKNGAWRCAALWSLENWSGVLLHRQGNKLLYAYIPLLTKETAELEHTISLALSQMAREVQDSPIMLEKSIPAGLHQLSELLEILSEEMEV